MECNKEEALRAKEISEAKLVEKDIVGAKKFAEKAEKLFPGLEGLSQLLMTINIHVSSEKKVNGESDWYCVLGVKPTADDETIRKNYRKLALSLHPDKNKSVGAEGAFKLVSEAWTLLSDKLKRKIYDQKRNPKETSTSTTQRPLNTNTFWTKCTRCFMHFEYLKVYLNQNIRCPNCREPFWALELPAPQKNHPATMWYSQRQNQNQNQSQNSNHHVGVKQGPSLNPSNMNHHVNVHQGPSLSTKAVKTSGQLKRQHEVKVGSVKRDGVAKKRRVVEQSSVVNSNLGGERVNVSIQSKINNSTRELSQTEIRSMLMTKARKEIHKKMDEWAAEKASKKEVSEKKVEIINNGKKDAKEIILNGTKKGLDVEIESKNVTNTVETDHSEANDTETETKAVLMSVPDPDFHDFDMDRTEKSFVENQVWAAYDEDDGMPRYYAMIHNVISRKPFKMIISWLNSKGNSELGPINWVASGFPKTSGDFRIGKHETNTSLNSFSHKVEWTKGKKGVIQIYPRKGEVWALYKNWSSDWNEFTPDETIHKYDMVVVLEDYNEDKGIKVAPLVKVSGFKSVFHQHCDVKESWTICKEETFRFSHQVLFYMLTGEEAINVPKGCFELDPAALPLELLKTTVEAKVKPIITYSRKIVAKKAKFQGKEIDESNKAYLETKPGNGFRILT